MFLVLISLLWILSDAAESDVEIEPPNEGPSPLPEKLKNKLLKIKEHASELISVGSYQERDQWSLAPDSESSLRIVCDENLSGTWLGSPNNHSSETDESKSDWLNSKHSFPNNKSRKSHIPPKGHSPYFPVPFAFSDKRTKDFIEAKIITNNRNIKLEGSAFLHGAPLTITPSANQKSLALIDKLLRDSLGEVLGLTGLLKYLFNVFAAHTNRIVFEIAQNILFVVIFALLRARDLLASSLLRVREIIRDQTLVRLKGKSHSSLTKESLKHSDFGLPTLFGPVRDQVESLVSPSIRGADAEDFQLSLPSQKPQAGWWSKGGSGKHSSWGGTSSRGAKRSFSNPKRKAAQSAPISQSSVFPKGPGGNKRKKKSKFTKAQPQQKQA